MLFVYSDSLVVLIWLVLGLAAFHSALHRHVWWWALLDDSPHVGQHIIATTSAYTRGNQIQAPEWQNQHPVAVYKYLVTETPPRCRPPAQTHPRKATS